jgi:uncharacterized LabA/DUF88 family protein
MIGEPAKLYAMAFIDGQNLYRHAKDAFGHHHPNFDPIKLHTAVCKAKGWTSNLVRFYTGVPDPKESPMWAAYWSNRVLAMKRAGIHVTTRPIRYHEEMVLDNDGEPVLNEDGNARTVKVAQEKGVDVRLALDVVSCARTRQFNVVVIYSQDQDLCEVVQEIHGIAKEQSREIVVACAFPSGPKATFHRGIDKTQWFKMDEDFYNACLDPHDYRPRT